MKEVRSNPKATLSRRSARHEVVRAASRFFHFAALHSRHPPGCGGRHGSREGSGRAPRLPTGNLRTPPPGLTAARGGRCRRRRPPGGPYPPPKKAHFRGPGEPPGPRRSTTKTPPRPCLASPQRTPKAWSWISAVFPASRGSWPALPRFGPLGKSRGHRSEKHDMMTVALCQGV